jgi:hypothetical protein
VGIKFSFPIIKGRFLKKSRPRKMAWKWDKSGEGKHLENREIFERNSKSLLPSSK